MRVITNLTFFSKISNVFSAAQRLTGLEVFQLN